MKKIFTLFTFLFLTVTCSLLAQTEMLDSTFHFDGMVTTDIGTNTDYISGIAIQSDGKIVAVGSAKISSITKIAVLRYNSDGSLDNTFGTGGIVTTSIGSFDAASAVAIQHDGKIVVGAATLNTTLDFAILRYDTNGVLDPTFDGDGIAIAPVGAGNDVARAMLIQPDGKIVLAGKVMVGSVLNFGLARFDTTGTLDNTFDGDGVLTTAFGINPADQADCFSIKLQPDGKIVATGDYTPNGGNIDGIPLARYNTDGSLDNTFGTGGKIVTHVAADFNIGKSMVLQPDGKIVVVSEQKPLGSNNYDFVLCRYDTVGSPDSTFGTNSIVVTDLFGNDDRPAALLLQPDGKIIAAGFSWVGLSLLPDFGLVRYLSDGNLDNSFGIGGKVWTDFGPATNTITSLALQADGKLVAGGAIDAGTPTSDFALSRYIPNVTTGIQNYFSGSSSITIYPNPGSGVFQFNIDQSMLAKNFQLEVYNAMGQKILNAPFTKSIDLSEVPDGIYLVKIFNPSENYMCKLVVN